jgi:SAM-dependent methyltransferase
VNDLKAYDLVQYEILNYLYPKSPNLLAESSANSKLDLLGGEFVKQIPGREIIDFGCGHGSEAIAMAKLGAKTVIGLDIQEAHLEKARREALDAGVGDRCVFSNSTRELADIIISLDAFEHFSDPAEILATMYGLLKPGGTAFISFGPTWYHPLGGHMFSVFPWAHLVFSENSLLRWRAGFKPDGATRFEEVAGGLNRITIRKFKKLVDASEFNISKLEMIPIRKIRGFHNRITQEFTTAVVRSELHKQHS